MLQQIEEQSGEQPAALKERPVLTGMLRRFFEAFDEICADRSWAEGVPFPLTSRNFLDYFELNGIDREDWPVYVDYFTRIDRLWLDYKLTLIKRARDRAAQAAKSGAKTGA